MNRGSIFRRRPEMPRSAPERTRSHLMKSIPLARLAVLFTLTTATAQAADELPAGSDGFATAPAITTANGISERTDLTGYSDEASEPGHRPTGGNAALKSAWWSWTAPETGFCTVDTRRGNGLGNGILDTVIGVYQGASVNSLTVVSRNDDHGNYAISADLNLSSITFYAQAGMTYRIAVDGRSPSDVTATRYEVILQVRLVPLRKMVRNGAYTLAKSFNEILDMGSLTLTTTGTGRFTAKLVTRTKTHAFKGAFDATGYFTYSYEPPFKNGVPQGFPATLTIDIAGEGYFVLQQGGYETGGVFRERASFTKLAPATTAGRYTGHFANGTLTATVSPLGVIKAVCTAPDGTAVTFSSALHKTGASAAFAAPAHVQLHKKKGGLTASLLFTEEGEKDVFTGNFRYQRPAAPAAVFYPDGLITSTNDTSGHTYTPPASGSRARGFLDGTNGAGVMTVTNSNGELPDGSFAENLTLATTNKFSFTSPARKPVLKLNVKTGIITGSINEPSNKKRLIKGVLIDNYGLPIILGITTGTKNTLALKVAP